MRYNQIRECDIANGNGIGVSLFVQGCHFHCKNCFNQETWDFNGGKEFDDNTYNKFMELLNNKHISRLSILGGEPLCEENISMVNKIIMNTPKRLKIWIYSGYEFEELNSNQLNVIKNIDYLVDGRYVDELNKPNLQFRGSTNQRIIDVKATLAQNKIITNV